MSPFSFFPSHLSFQIHFHIEGSYIERILLDPLSGDGIELYIHNNKDATLSALIHSWLNGYLQGQDSILLPTKELAPTWGSEVLHEMKKISFGKTVSYGELATLAKRPKAARAVGKVCNSNPFPLYIPCHRVTAKTSLGGFAYGLELKLKILRYERELLEASF